LSVQRILNGLKNTLPGPLLAAALRLNAQLRPLPGARQEREIYAALGRPTQILGGPFSGMNYLSWARGSVLVAKLLGTYELELRGAIETAIAWEPDVVVDVGSAEGYYAVGIARRLNQARVIAFDTDRYAQYLLGKLAAKNEVADRVTMDGWCSVHRLQEELAKGKRPLVICDCEGFEDELLRLEGAPGLSRAIIVVELHDAVVPGIGGRLRERFGGTHGIEEVMARPRQAADLPSGTSLSTERAEAAMAERRPDGMSWLVMMPK
jgi:hypothetical protein